MRILVIGSGGREHTIAWKLLKDNPGSTVVAAPGNGGTATLGSNLTLHDTQIRELASWASKNADLTVVGPEAPLTAGIVDLFEQSGLKVFGPGQSGARLESSKVFSKEFMRRHAIPTAAFSVFDDFEKAVAWIEKRDVPCVVKYDGLAAGKGVKVAATRKEAVSFLDEIYHRRIFGHDSDRVVIEDCLCGHEMSYLIITDGTSYVPLEPAQDYKRALDGDGGENTGGMGTYCPSRFITPALRTIIHATIVEPTLAGLRKDGIPYRGVLYCGLMLTDTGPSLLEYNVRFGDPETQTILPRLETNLLEIIAATIEGRLESVHPSWSSDVTVCVVLASGGYPAHYEKGKEITGFAAVRNALVFHAGTTSVNGRLLTNGGRVLGVVGKAGDFKAARKNAYAAAETISFEGKSYRKDIALFDG